MPALALKQPPKACPSERKAWGKTPNARSITQHRCLGVAAPQDMRGEVKREERKRGNIMGRKGGRRNFLKIVFLFKPSFTGSQRAALHDPPHRLHLLVQTIFTCSGTRSKLNPCRGGWGRFAEASCHFSKHFFTIHLHNGMVLSHASCSSGFC